MTLARALAFLLAANLFADGPFNLQPRVTPPSDALRAQEPRRPDPLLPDADLCYRGIPVPPGLARLPDYHAYVGRGRSEYLIPITRDPQRHVEPGDVLVFPQRVRRDSPGLLEAVTLGQYHVAIVGREPRSGRLFALHSPQENARDLEAIVPFHILRLNADRRGRDRVLRRVNRFVELLSRDTSRYSYDHERVTEPGIDGEMRRLARSLRRGQCPAGLSLYCSELVAMVYGAAGVRPATKTYSVLYALPAIEGRLRQAHAALPRGSVSYEDFLDRGVDQMLADADVLKEMGFPNGLRTDQDRAEFAQARTLLKDLLRAKPEDRAELFRARNLFSRRKGEIIGPAEYFLEPFLAGGNFSYVATYVKDTCRPRREGALDAVPSEPSPTLRRLLEERP